MGIPGRFSGGGKTYRECLVHTQMLVDLLHKLGLQINVAKSVLVPSQLLPFLGLVLDLKAGYIRVPKSKLDSLVTDVARLGRADSPTVRTCSSILGKLRSLIFAVPQMRLFTHALSNHVNYLSRGGWDSSGPLPQEVLLQLEEALTELRSWQGRDFVLELPKSKLYTDSSTEGWGGVVPGSLGTWGWFTTPQEHINDKEFKAAIYTLKLYLLRDTLLDLYVDNLVFYFYLKKWGGRVRRLNSLMRELWVYCKEMNVTITPHYVPSADNPAYFLSRKTLTLGESSLDPISIEKILSHFWWIQPETDWMASDVNSQCVRFVSGVRLPGCAGVDVFKKDLQAISPGWCNTPWYLIPQVLNMLNNTPAFSVLLLFPLRRGAPWCPLFMALADSWVPVGEAEFTLPTGVTKAAVPLACGQLCRTTTSVMDGLKRKSIGCCRSWETTL